MLTAVVLTENCISCISEHIVEMAKSKYAKYFVRKLLKYGYVKQSIFYFRFCYDMLVVPFYDEGFIFAEQRHREIMYSESYMEMSEN